MTLPFRFPESCIDRQRKFEGRSGEMEKIASHLTPEANTAASANTLRCFTITGLGGIGKTELARRYVAEYHTAYSVLIYLTTDSTHRLSESYNKLAMKLGLLTEADKPGHEECREALKAWFKNPRQVSPSRTIGSDRISDESDQPLLQWLLVFDNVEDWATVAPYWPEKGCGSILVTSRNPHVLSQSVHLEPTGNLKLDVLSPHQASCLLKYYAGYDDDSSDSVQQAARHVATQLEYLPLAIIQVGSYIKQCQISIPRFVQIHREESGLHNVYLESERVQDYEYNLASVWAVESLTQGRKDDAHGLSESSLGTKRASEQAYAILCLIALLDAEGISEDLLKPIAQPIISHYPTNEPELHQRFRVLAKASLVERDSKDSDITVHRMVQKVVRAKIARDFTLCQQVFHQATNQLGMLWPYLDRIYAIGSQGNIDRWPRCAILLPHILALSQAYLEFYEKKSLTEPCLDFAELLYEAAT